MKRITSNQYRNKFIVKKRSKRKQTDGKSEEQEQAALCAWLKDKYPNVLYTVDLGGIRLSQNQKRIMSTRSRKGHPDLMFQEWFLDKYCGLAIEFKKTGVVVENKDGTLRKNKHLESQLSYLIALKERFHIAGFVCGIENAKAVISAYLEANSNSIATINKYIFPRIAP